MPDVGVLELQIRDNADQAGGGLENLADAISRVKTAVGKGLGLGTVATQVTKLASTINAEKSTNTTLKNLSSLFNAISNFSKLGKVNIDVKPFKDIKEALGNGISLGQAGTQLKNIREAMTGDWDASGSISNMHGIVEVGREIKESGTAKSFNDLAKSLNNYAKAYKSLPKDSSKISSVVRDIMDTGRIEAGNILGNNVSGNIVDYSKIADEWDKEQKLIFREPLEDSFESVQSQLNDLFEPNTDGFTSSIQEEFQQVNSIIQESTESVKEYKESIEATTQTFGENAKDAVVKDVSSSVAFLTERWKNAANEVGTYGNRITDAVLPKMNELSAEEMIIKKNGELATAAIERLITRLNTVGNKTGKGFSGIVDLMTGVSRGGVSTSSAEDSAKTISNNLDQIIEVEKELDRVAEIQSRINNAAEESKPIINMENIPASGNNGPFANAAEEVEYLKSKLNEAKESLSQWESVYERTQKQIKYNGATEERTNMLGHAEEGFYSQLEQIKQLEEEISKLCTYAQNYNASMQNVQDTVAPVASSIQEIGNSAEFSKKAMQTMFEHQQQRIAVIRELNKDSSDKVKEQVAALIGLKPEDIWGKAVTEIQNATNAVQEYGSAMASVVGNNNVRDYGNELVENLANNYSQIDLYEMKLGGLKQALADDINMNKVDRQQIADRMLAIQALTEKIEGLKQAQEESTGFTASMSKAWEEFKNGIKKMFPTLSGLIKRFAQIVKYRMLRAILKHITAGFSEGMENVYNYSKLVGTELAPAMDSAATSFQQLKNSIGAAVAPLVTAFIPVINQVISVVITVINYINQFFALLNGQKTWTRALPATTSAFDKQTKAAKGASAAIKDLLADWDELNIIQSETSGGGGGGSGKTAEDYLSMFEEVDKFDDKIRSVIDFIHDNFDNLKKAALDVGAAILGWKISEAFAGVLGIIGGLVATGAIIDFTLQLTDAFGKQYVTTGDPGWFIADALTGALGASLAGIVAKKVAGGSWGLITAGFTLTLAGEVNLKNARAAWAQELYAESKMLSILGSTEKGIGAALIAMGFTASTPVALAIGAAVGVYSYVVNALAEVNITGIKWGTQTLSQEEVEEFVRSQMMSIDIDSVIKITKAALELSWTERSKLTLQATKLLAPLTSLKLRVNVEESLEQIKHDVFDSDGLIEQFKSFTASQKEVVSTAETYAPTIDASGKDISGEILKDSSGAWAELNSLMDGLGADLSRHLTNSMNKTLSEELRESELKMVEEITDTMIRVTMAGKRATSGSNALTDLAFNLTNATQGTFEDVLTEFNRYKDQLYDELKEIKKEEAASFANAAAMYNEFANDALRKAGGDESDPLYRKYKDKAQEMADRYTDIIYDLDASVKASVDEASAPGRKMVAEALEELLRNAMNLYDGKVKLFENGKIMGLPQGVAGGLKENTQLALQELMFGGMNEGITTENSGRLKELFKNWLDAIIQDFFPNDFNIIQEAIHSGIIDYNTIFDPDALFSYLDMKGYNTSFYKQMWGLLFPDTGSHETKHVSLEDMGIDLDIDAKDLYAEPITVEPELKLEPVIDTDLEDLKKRINEAIEDGVLSWEEEYSIRTIYPDYEMFEKALNELKIEVDPEGNVTMNQSGRYNPNNFTVSGGGGAPMVYANAGEYQEPHDISGEVAVGVSGVESGVSTLHSDQGLLLHELNQLVSLCNQIARKEFVVNVNASSGWGSHNQRSQDLYERITGEVKA